MLKKLEEFCLVWSGFVKKNWRTDPTDSKKLEDRSDVFKKIGGHICHFVLLDQKSTPCTTHFNFLGKRPQLSLALSCALRALALENANVKSKGNLEF